jgi:hypothetical protein
MEALESANLALRFLLELCVLLAVGYWGFRTGRSTPAKIGLGLGLPLLIAVIWGTLVAPNTPVELPTPLRVLVELVIFGAGVAALYPAERPRLAWVFAGLVVVNEVLLYALEQERQREGKWIRTTVRWC